MGLMETVFAAGDKVRFKEEEKPRKDGDFDGVFTVQAVNRSNTFLSLVEIPHYDPSNHAETPWSRNRFEKVETPTNEEFKVGDRVAVINSAGDGRSRIGDTGFVTGIEAGFARRVGETQLLTVMTDRGQQIAMFNGRFKSVAPAPESIAPADTPQKVVEWFEVVVPFRTREAAQQHIRNMFGENYAYIREVEQ